MKAIRARYHCPPIERGQKPWCSALPCHGHQATRDQQLIALVLIFLDGGNPQDLFDPRWGGIAERPHYLQQARRVLASVKSSARP